MLLKGYDWVDLEKYFWENLFLKKTKINECGILNLDSSSGLSYVFEKCKEKFYFDSYGVLQPPSELIAYLKSSIFYNSDRTKRWGNLRSFISLRIETAFVGNNVQAVIICLI